MRELAVALLLAAAPDAGAPPAAPAPASVTAPAPAAAVAPAGLPADTGEKVTLAAAVQRALQRNPSVAIAAQEIERADALITQARAGWFPNLTGNGLYTRLDH